MNSDMVKPENFGHLHLVYHFTVRLKEHTINGKHIGVLSKKFRYIKHEHYQFDQSCVKEKTFGNADLSKLEYWGNIFWQVQQRSNQ